MRSKLGMVATMLVALALAAPAAAHEAGQWVVRAGAGTVAPKSGNLGFGDVNLADGSVITGSSIEVDDGTSLVLSATYMIHDNWAVDILGALPFEHDIDLVGTLNGSSVTVPLGSTKHLPPTVSLQYHFKPDAAFQPYVGVGVNFTLFSSESVNQQVQNDASLLEIELEESSGLALQVGADWMFGDNWLANLDVRWIQIRSNLRITVDDAGTIISGIDVPGLVEIDPWVYSLSVGYTFD